MREIIDLPPLSALLAAQAGREMARHKLLWAFDARLAQIARTTHEPLIAQMKLAWWNDALSDAAALKGRGEPILDGLRGCGAVSASGLMNMLEGWELLIVEPELDRQSLSDYATARGGGLFQALAGAGDIPDWLIDAGAVWALWDLSGHVGDSKLATEAIMLGNERLLAKAPRWPKMWRPMRVAYALARNEIFHGRRSPQSLTRRLYLRLVWLTLTER
jgi:hypothetical protein